MARKATPSRPKQVAEAKKTTRSAKKTSPAPAPGKKAKPATTTKRAAAASTPVSRKKAAGTSPGPSGAPPVREPLSPAEVLARAEADVTAAIDTLNQHMNAALNTFTELASAQHGRGKAVIRTAPLDRATAAFQRLVAEVVDEQLAEMLPPLVGLRNEFVRRAGNGQSPDAMDAALCRHGAETLDHVLTLAGARLYQARVGEAFDPLIHLAVGETHRPDLADGAVAEPLQPGFRSARGKVLVPAKVKVNRR